AGGKTETPEAPEIVDVAKPDQAERHAEHRNANDDLDDQPRRAVQSLGNRRQIQMIVAAGGDSRADEDGVDEKRGGNFLQPEPGVAYLPGDDVAGHRQGKPEA